MGLGENVVMCLINTWVSLSNLLACLPTKELTTFVQQVGQIKIGNATALSLETNSCRKKNVASLNIAHQAKILTQF